MEFNRKTLRKIMAYFLPLLFSFLLNTFDHIPIQGDIQKWEYLPIMHFGVLSSLLIEAVYIQWYFSVRRRFPQKQMRGNVTLFMAAFILLSLLQLMKYSYVTQGGTAARYLWYAYYVPLTFGPLFMVHASLYFGKPDDYRISKKWYWAYLPAALISLGILTNDWHQLAFRFPDGLADWEHDYSHGVLYVLAFVWGGLGLVTVIALAVRSTYHRRLFKSAWLPVIVLAVMAVYPLLYAYPGQKILFIQDVFEMNDFICISCLALWESFVFARIIVPNSDYPSIFAVSSLNAGLADGDYQVRQVSARGVRPLPQQLCSAAQNGGLLLEDGDRLLKARPVPGGWFYWTEDVSELRRLREELNDTADYLEEENAMLRVSAQIEEGRRQTAEQTKLYDRVTESLRPQLDELDGLLPELPENEASFRRTIQKAGVLIAYAKRRSNLLLLADSHPVLTGEELGLCFEESAKARRMAEIPCEVFVEQEIHVPSGDAVALYEAFETVAERAFDALRSVRITLNARPDGRTVMGITLEGAEASLTEDGLAGLRRLVEEISVSHNGVSTVLTIMANNGNAGRGL